MLETFKLKSSATNLLRFETTLKTTNLLTAQRPADLLTTLQIADRPKEKVFVSRYLPLKTNFNPREKLIGATLICPKFVLNISIELLVIYQKRQGQKT